jgi:hypothetical protein
MLIDLHNHTRLLSPCSILEPQELVEAAIAAGLDGIAITEHDAWFPERLAVRIGTGTVSILIGSELTAGRHHVLAFGELLRPGPYESLNSLFDAALDREVALVLAHPFRWHSPLLDMEERKLATLFRRFQAIEVASCNLDPVRQQQAIRFCLEHDIPMTAGSDAHGPEMLASYATRFHGPPFSNATGLARALQERSFEPVSLTPDGPQPLSRTHE